MERDKRERGELVVALGPFCVPCGKRFAKQTVYDAHLSGKKHLAALQRMGRDEEAMVCQIDMEAKRRKLQASEEARRSVMTTSSSITESEEETAARLAAREEKLRQRAMLPMPTTVAATSVYGEVEDAEAGGAEASSVDATCTDTNGTKAGSSSTSAPSQMSAVETDADMARAGSGANMSYTNGMQDGSQRVNRHTTPGLAAVHRSLAVPASGTHLHGHALPVF
jgi:hypothetical protein